MKNNKHKKRPSLPKGITRIRNTNGMIQVRRGLWPRIPDPKNAGRYKVFDVMDSTESHLTMMPRNDMPTCNSLRSSLVFTRDEKGKLNANIISKMTNGVQYMKNPNIVIDALAMIAEDSGKFTVLSFDEVKTLFSSAPIFEGAEQRVLGDAEWRNIHLAGIKSKYPKFTEQEVHSYYKKKVHQEVIEFTRAGNYPINVVIARNLPDKSGETSFSMANRIAGEFPLFERFFKYKQEVLEMIPGYTPVPRNQRYVRNDVCKINYVHPGSNARIRRKELMRVQAEERAAIRKAKKEEKDMQLKVAVESAKRENGGTIVLNDVHDPDLALRLLYEQSKEE